MNNTQSVVKYPSSGRRLVAWLTDAVVVGIVIFLGRFLFFAACAQFKIELSGGKVTMISLGIGVAIAILYHMLFESSKFQATPGKFFTSLAVTDLDGQRISPQRALARHLSKYASTFSFGVGYLIFFFSKKKQCLHDMLAKCLIVQKTKSKLF